MHFSPFVFLRRRKARQIARTSDLFVLFSKGNRQHLAHVPQPRGAGGAGCIFFSKKPNFRSLFPGARKQKGSGWKAAVQPAPIAANVRARSHRSHCPQRPLFQVSALLPATPAVLSTPSAATTAIRTEHRPAPPSTSGPTRPGRRCSAVSAAPRARGAARAAPGPWAELRAAVGGAARGGGRGSARRWAGLCAAGPGGRQRRRAVRPVPV